MNGPLPRLIALTDRAQFPDCGVQAVRLCEEAKPGSVMIVLRDRGLSLRERYRWGTELRAVTRRTGQLLSGGQRAERWWRCGMSPKDAASNLADTCPQPSAALWCGARGVGTV